MSSVNTLKLTGDQIPERLRHIPDAPDKLFVRGLELDRLLTKPVVAIVGSRKVDAYGKYVTDMLARELSERGVVIVSGLALGIDAIAHLAALEAGSETIAVLPSSVEKPYPRTNDALARRITHNGCLVSETNAEYAYAGKHIYLIRNRLISGLSDVVIVTQAATRSGSLNTARHALEQGKTVMAVPGPITNPLCEGTNNLLKMGAVPVTSVQDVLRELGIDESEEVEINYELLAKSEAELTLLHLLASGISDGENLLAKSELGTQEFNAVLTMLEIRGVVTPLGGNQWSIKA